MAARRGYVRPEDFATIVAVFLVGLLWLRARIGLDLTLDRIARAVWIAVGILTVMTVWGSSACMRACAVGRCSRRRRCRRRSAAGG